MTTLMKTGDFHHEIVFVKDGRMQMLVLVPFGPTRATQAAAEAIVRADQPDMMSATSLVWVKAVPQRPENYKLGDVGNSPDKRELLAVVTADRSGGRISTINEVIRNGDEMRLEKREFGLPKGMIVPEMQCEDPSP